MNQPERVSGDIEVVGECAYCRPVGTVTLEQSVELVDQALVFARDRQIPKLLVNCKGLIGFRSPTLPERYFIVRQWAATAKGLVQVALVIRSEMMDPEKFGVTVARNSGLNADVFLEEAEALAWLLGGTEK